MKVIIIASAVILVIGGLAVAQFRHQFRQHQATLNYEVDTLTRKTEKLRREKSELEEEIKAKSADWEDVSIKVEEVESVEAQIDEYIQLLPTLLRGFNEKQSLAEGYQKAFTLTSDLRQGQAIESVKLGNGETYTDVVIKEIKDGQVSFRHSTGLNRKPLDSFPDELHGDRVVRPSLSGYYLKDFATFVEEIPEPLLVGAFEDQVDDFRSDQRSLQRKLQREAQEMELQERERAREAQRLRHRYAEALKRKENESKQLAASRIESSNAMREMLNESEVARLNGEIDKINYAIRLSYSRYNSRKIRSDRRAFQNDVDYKLAEISRRQNMIADLGGSYHSATELPEIERPVRAVQACSGSS